MREAPLYFLIATALSCLQAFTPPCSVPVTTRPSSLPARARDAGLPIYGPLSTRTGGQIPSTGVRSLIVHDKPTEELLYRDDHICVYYKPSGLLSVPGRYDKDSLISRAAIRFKRRPDKMAAHRLDEATSGLIVVALSDEALRDLHEQFRSRDVRKEYMAIVYGNLRSSEGWVDIPIIKDPDNPPKQMVDTTKGKSSQTYWEVLKQVDGLTLLKMRPYTGRSHQLRMHALAMGHPIVGDYFYSPPHVADLTDRLLLHAHSLCIDHPITHEPMRFVSPTPFDLNTSSAASSSTANLHLAMYTDERCYRPCCTDARVVNTPIS